MGGKGKLVRNHPACKVDSTVIYLCTNRIEENSLGNIVGLVIRVIGDTLGATLQQLSLLMAPGTTGLEIERYHRKGFFFLISKKKYPYIYR